LQEKHGIPLILRTSAIAAGKIRKTVGNGTINATSGTLRSELNQLQQPEKSESFLDFSFASFKNAILAPETLQNGNAARQEYPPCMQILWVPLSNSVASQQSKLKFEPTPTFVASLRGY
jgi:hypothetical protein